MLCIFQLGIEKFGTRFPVYIIVVLRNDICIETMGGVMVLFAFTMSLVIDLVERKFK